MILCSSPKPESYSKNGSPFKDVLYFSGMTISAAQMDLQQFSILMLL